MKATNEQIEAARKSLALNKWAIPHSAVEAALNASFGATTNFKLAPVEPTQAMLDAARDWSRAKYGKPIGNDGAIGCWHAMLGSCG